MLSDSLFTLDLHPSRYLLLWAIRPITSPVTPQESTVENLKVRIADLVGERQQLRAREAPSDQLEANRRQIATLQHELSEALIALYLPPAQPGLA